jgi:ubiquinone/menaquinone biosynthesis C-methylase UbiE
MGRRGVSVDEEDRWVFNRLAHGYGHRPGYPEALVERLSELAQGGEVVDLGAGTGHLALPLARRGLGVRAVEPARRMLEVLAVRARAEGLGVEAVHAVAERTGVSDEVADLVLIADVLHWLDPEQVGAEARRLLRPGGALAVVEVALEDNPFQRALTELLAQANPKARSRSRSSALAQLFAIALGERPHQVERFAVPLALTPEQLEQVLRTHSFVAPALGEVGTAALVARAVSLAAVHGGARWDRRFTLTWARAG